MRILVTGGSGFVGQNLVKKLVELGHDVAITSSGTEQFIPKVKVLYKSLEGIDWLKVHGQDLVIHQSANNDTRCQDEYEMFRANLYGPIRLFEEAFKGGCKRFIYASSTAVYGDEPAPYVEGVTKVNPLNKYGKSKAAFDEFAMRFGKEKEVSVIGFRYCNVYGPGEDHKGRRMSMIGQMLRTMMKGNSPTLFEYGEQKRDWIYVKDVVEAHLCAIRVADVGTIRDIYNMGSGVASTFNEIVDAINEVKFHRHDYKMSIKPVYVPCPFPDEYQTYTQCDMKKAGDELGFVPRWDLKSGIIDYYQSLIAS